jgi:RNA polymerase sigma factor (TIGR02999 family)
MSDRASNSHSADVSPSVTRVLARLRDGDREAFDELVPLVYDELRGIAQRQMSRQPTGHTLQATALVHEAVARLSSGGDDSWQDRVHFFSAAARAMRCVLVDHARSKARVRRRSTGERVPFDDIVAAYEERSFNLVELDDALDQLATFDPRLARTVELRFFAGLGVDEIAKVLQISRRSVERELTCAKAWLRKAFM